MKETTAKTFLEIYVTCPHCGAFDDVTEELKYSLDRGELSASGIDAEITCSECEEKYIVTEITY